MRLGELVQIDGSDHRWFEDRAPACTLLVFIDDATGRLMVLHFTATESTFSYFEAVRKYLEAHGKPVAFYSDKASVFYVKGRSETAAKGVTQFGRALYELNVDAFCANTSQAKGRVERANLTLQDRLVKELRLRGISTREAANAYAPSFIADFNRRFGKPPRSDHDAHRTLRADEDLRQILAYRVPRRVSNALTVQYDRVMYLLDDTPDTRALMHEYVEVVEYPDGVIEIQAQGCVLSSRQYDRIARVDQGAEVENKRLASVLEVARCVQAIRDDRLAEGSPSRTHAGEEVRARKALLGLKKQRAIDAADIKQAVLEVSARAMRGRGAAAPPHPKTLKKDKATADSNPDIPYMVASHLQGNCSWRGGWLRTYIRTRSRDVLAGPDGFRRKGPNLLSGLEVRVMSQVCPCAVQPVLPSFNTPVQPWMGHLPRCLRATEQLMPDTFAHTPAMPRWFAPSCWPAQQRRRSWDVGSTVHAVVPEDALRPI